MFHREHNLASYAKEQFQILQSHFTLSPKAYNL